MYDITVIGAAIVDVLAAPADPAVFTVNSMPADEIRLSFGGDALNESVILSRMGKKVQLITKIGADESGRRVLNYMRENGIRTDSAKIEEGLATGINIVLIDPDGERHFLTNPTGSLRKLGYDDIAGFLDQAGRIVSMASMFISPLLTIDKMEGLFRQIKESGRIVFADLTTAKNGEILSDLQELLQYVDVIVPNESEIAHLTGETDPYRNVRLLLEAGVGTAVVKIGARGCVLGDPDGIRTIPAVQGVQSVDSTGAGDAFAAGYLTGMAERLCADDCARLGCAAASCAIERVGATEGVKDAEEVRRRYRML